MDKSKQLGYNMQNTNPRRRGRPKGSKNKNNVLAGATIERICEYKKFDPALKLIDIARNDDDSTWDSATQFEATKLLFNAIHCKKPIMGGELLDAPAGTNYEIVFVEPESDGLTIPGTADAGSDTQSLEGLQVPGTGDSPPIW